MRKRETETDEGEAAQISGPSVKFDPIFRSMVDY